MSRRKGVRFVSVLLVISSLLLLLSFFGVTQKPIRGAKRFEQGKTSVPAPTEGENPETDPTREEEPLPSEDPEESEVLLYDLPILDNDPDELPRGGEALRLWPETLSIPRLHEPNLDAYLGLESSAEPLRGITVILDATRGGADTGAVWGTGEGAVTEKRIVLEIALIAERKLAERGATVVMTRTTDEEFSFFRTVAKAAEVALIRYGEAAELGGYHRDAIDNLRLLMSDIIRINQNSPSSGGRGLFGSIGTPPQLRILYDIESQYSDTLFISLALGNDPNDPSRHGSQSYFMSAPFVEQVNNEYAVGQDANTLAPNYTNIDSEGRRKLASLLKSSLASAEPFLAPEDGKNEGEERDMAVLRLTNYVSASFSPGYLSNDSDRQLLTSERGREVIGEAIADAVTRYYTSP